MPSVRQNWMLAVALVAAVAPAAAAADGVVRREPAQRQAAAPSPVYTAPSNPSLGPWTVGSEPRQLPGLREPRRSATPAPIALQVSGAVALLDVASPPSQTRRPAGFAPMLVIDEVPAALQQRQVKRLAVMPAEILEPVVLTPGETR